MNQKQREKCLAHDIRHDCLVKLRAAATERDTEKAHSDADNALIELLYEIEPEIWEAYVAVKKWYA